MSEHEQQENLVALPPARRAKLTAERLRQVAELQAALTSAAEAAETIASEEMNGWTPGSPIGNRSPRVEPLQKLARDLTDAVDALEALYS